MWTTAGVLRGPVHRDLRGASGRGGQTSPGRATRSGGRCGSENGCRRGSSAHRRAASTHARGTVEPGSPPNRARTPPTRPATVGAVASSHGARNAVRAASTQTGRGNDGRRSSEAGCQQPPVPHVSSRYFGRSTHGSTTPPSRSRAVDQPGSARWGETCSPGGSMPCSRRANTPTRVATTSRASSCSRGQPRRRRSGDQAPSMVRAARSSDGLRPNHCTPRTRSTAATVHGNDRRSRCHSAAAGGPDPTTAGECRWAWTNTTTMPGEEQVPDQPHAPASPRGSAPERPTGGPSTWASGHREALQLLCGPGRPQASLAPECTQRPQAGRVLVDPRCAGADIHQPGRGPTARPRQ